MSEIDPRGVVNTLTLTSGTTLFAESVMTPYIEHEMDWGLLWDVLKSNTRRLRI
jgi:hypothetical protein